MSVMKKKLKILAVFIIFAGILSYPVLTQPAPFKAGFAAAIAVLPCATQSGASVIDQLCSSVVGFLDDEAAKAGAAVKACKDKCAWKKRKDELISAARKKAKDSCSKGEAPNINELNKGLDGNAKERLKSLYDRNNRMFDGKPKLPDKDLEPVPSRQAVALTGKGGGVADLKAYEPALPKLGRATEFSLSGTKLFGGTPDLVTTKQSMVLLASVALAKTSTGTASASQAKSPAAAVASAKSSALSAATAAQASPPKDCASCRKLPPEEFSFDCYKMCCAEGVESECYSLCLNWAGRLTPPMTQCECCKFYKSACYSTYLGCKGSAGWWDSFKTVVGGFTEPFKNLFHKILWGEEPCGGGYYKTKTQCCVRGTIPVPKCGAECYDPEVEYCDNGAKEDKCEGAPCSAGNITASPVPVNNEVILPIGATATLSISGENPPGGRFQWSTSGGTLTPLSDRQATITSMGAGKITVTVNYKTAGKPCSKCRTSIVVAFVQVLKIRADRTSVNTGATITFTVTTEPAGSAYMSLVHLTPIATPPDYLQVNLIVPVPESTFREKGIFVYKINAWAGTFVMRATAGGSDAGQLSDPLWVF